MSSRLLVTKPRLTDPFAKRQPYSRDSVLKSFCNQLHVYLAVSILASIPSYDPLMGYLCVAVCVTRALTTLIILNRGSCRFQNRYPPLHLAHLFACLFLRYLFSKQVARRLQGCRPSASLRTAKIGRGSRPQGRHSELPLLKTDILIYKLFALSSGFASPLGHDRSVDLHTRNAP